MDEPIQVIGLDCATDPKKTGLCRGWYEEGRLRVEEAVLGSDEQRPLDHLAKWVRGKNRSLIGIDAPLGWPDPLREVLSTHRAGQPTRQTSRSLFSRRTDEFIHAQQRFGKWPLEVGANFIARTANHALALLESLRGEVGRSVELAWFPSELEGVMGVEVYPWATMTARGIKVPSYKLKGQVGARSDLLDAMSENLGELDDSVREACLASADVLDAVVAALAATDFLAGKCDAPPEGELEMAKREGWIWVVGERW